MIDFICLITLGLTGGVLQDWDDKRLTNEVEYFGMGRGFVQTIEATHVSEFIELIGEQRTELYDIQQSYRAKADSIVAQSGLSLIQRYEQLVQLRDQQDSDLKNVLLPDQLHRLEFFDRYVRILDQGFANSLINGDLVGVLDLSDAERIEVNKAAEKMSLEYREVLIKAQLKAISRIRKSLPEVKRNKFDEILEPLLAEDGTFWDVDTRMLETGHDLNSGGQQNSSSHISEIDGIKPK